MPAPSQTAADGDRCPVCARYLGAAAACPYCSEDAAHAATLRRLRRLALVLAVAGLAGLYAAATPRGVAVVRVADLTPLMQAAYVRAVGQIVRPPYVATRGGRVDYCSFQIDDGSGILRVQARRDVAAALAELRDQFAPGTVVEVSGSLDMGREREPSLRLDAATQVRIVKQGAHAAVRR